MKVLFKGNFNPALIIIYIHYKVWSEITDPSPNFNGATVEVWEWISNFIPHYWARDYQSMPTLKLIHVCKKVTEELRLLAL